jgi:hypothetical protein
LEDDKFDLITCFGVLHHIPNASFVFGKLVRTLKPRSFRVTGANCFFGRLEETRRGLIKRERGIPLNILGNIVQSSGVETIRQSLCAFPLTPRIFRLLRPDVYNSSIATKVDLVLSAAFAWNVNYHPRNTFQRLRPTSTFLILKKR